MDDDGVDNVDMDYDDYLSGGGDSGSQLCGDYDNEREEEEGDQTEASVDEEAEEILAAEE